MSDAAYVDDQDEPLADDAELLGDGLPPDEPPGEGDPEYGDLSIDDRARARGWKPLEEYRGDPKRWRTAEDFLRFGDEDNNSLRKEVHMLAARNHRQEGQLTRLQQDTDTLRVALDELKALGQRADKRGYERARAELMVQRQAAISNGEASQFEMIDAEVRRLDDDYRAPVAPPPAPSTPPAAAPPAIDPEIVTWAEDPSNVWFKADQQLNRAMISHMGVVETKWPAMAMRDKLLEAARRTRADFPERFEMPGQPPPRTPAPAPAPRQAPYAQPRGAAPRQPVRRSGFDVIEDPKDRAEARQQYERIRAADPGYTEEEHIAMILDPHADVLDLRQRFRK